MDSIWEKHHSQRSWGKYPEIDLVKTVMREFKNKDRSAVSVLELGCGAGANLSFFLCEGFQTYGIDGSPSAINNADKNLSLIKSSQQKKGTPFYFLSVGDFKSLPYESEMFTIVVDNLSIYANNSETIDDAYKEAFRVLKPNGFMYSRVWGNNTTGSKTGEMIDIHTSKAPLLGPCQGMGTSHFFSRDELLEHFSQFSSKTIKRITEENTSDDIYTEEWIVWAKK
ncbi:class I SAM-dependent methyltransferase [Agarilytica rhodophyticola]|uniref:class I SAM-dependent methyltransferase n=1 Tax=Agarilytica rhodophyticola TaxID=1737490 RepID=UPI00131A11F8|nr:class I SAM-dependent methyltransferase [Agarilytica rhodophyticola]